MLIQNHSSSVLKVHFRLTCAAQKRRCFNSLLLPVVTGYKDRIIACIRESGFRNLEILSFGSWSLQPGIKDSGIQVRPTKNRESRTWNPESTACNPE